MGVLNAIDSFLLISYRLETFYGFSHKILSGMPGFRLLEISLLQSGRL